MTLAERRPYAIEGSKLELPQHKLAERVGGAVVASLVIGFGLAMVAEYPSGWGWFLVGVIVFAALVAVALRWIGKTGAIDDVQARGEQAVVDMPHPGITMHKIPVKAGLAGLLFTLGSMLIFLVGIPALWTFLALAIVLGVGVAVVLRLLRADS
jgi:hypothetical protein